MPRNYWMVVTGLENFRITRRHGFKVQGLKSQHQRKMQRIEPGDRILYYVDAGKNFAATATAKSRYFEDHTPIWNKEGSANWNFRMHVQPDLVLDEFEFMDACQLAPRLDYVRKWQPEDWYLAFAQSSLHLLPKKDFMLIEEEMRKVKAKRSPRFGRGPTGDRRGPRASQPQAAPVGVPVEPETDGQALVHGDEPPPEQPTTDGQAQVHDELPPEQLTADGQALIHDEPPPREETTDGQAQVHGEVPPAQPTADEHAQVLDEPPPERPTTDGQALVHGDELPPEQPTADGQALIHDELPPEQPTADEQAQVHDGPPPREETTDGQAEVHDGPPPREETPDGQAEVLDEPPPQEPTADGQAQVQDELPPEQPPSPPQPEDPLPEPAPRSGPE